MSRMKKTSTTAYPIHPLLAERWSPVAFADRGVDAETLGSLLEAARWAPSSYNEQPWRFLVGTRAADARGFERLADCLVEGNAWARRAPVLILSVASLAFERNGKPNRHALHDVGLAAQNLSVQAEALGLSTHQMAGFDAERARTSCGIPEGFEPVAMIAVGYRAEGDAVPEALRAREAAARSRRALEEVAMGAAWGERPGWLG